MNTIAYQVSPPLVHAPVRGVLKEGDSPAAPRSASSRPPRVIRSWEGSGTAPVAPDAVSGLAR